MPNTSVQVVYRGDIDKFTEAKYSKVEPNLDIANIIFPTYEDDINYEKTFRKKLKKHLTSIQIEIVVDRFMYELTLKEIAENHGIVSLQVVHNQLTKAMQILRKKGFGKK